MGRRGGEKRPRKARRQARPAPAPAAPAPGEAPPGHDFRHDALAAAVLTLLLLAAYLPAFQAGFVWDDRIFTEARAVREWSGLWDIWFQPQGIVNEAHYWPLVYTSFWLEHKLWGFDPFGYHAVNILLHAANTLLLWRLARRLHLPGAWLLAALFAVHPLHVESVAWAIERKDLLSALFYLTAFGAWLRFTDPMGAPTEPWERRRPAGKRAEGSPTHRPHRQAPPPASAPPQAAAPASRPIGTPPASPPLGAPASRRQRAARPANAPTSPPGTAARKHYLLALALFVAGLLCKSIVVTLPLALALCQWWRQGQLRAGDLARLAPFVAVGAAIVLADTAYASSREPLVLDWTFAERVLIASQALWFYAGKLLWPAGLIVIYPHWPVEAADPLAWGWPIALLALLAVLWLLRDRLGRGPLAGVLFFAVTLSPVLGFVDYGYMQFSFVADRYQYLAGIGLLAIAAGAASVAAGALSLPWRRGGAAAGAIVLAVLAILTFRQAELYRDGVTFFSHIVAHNPTARQAHRNLGEALVTAGRPQEALEAFLIAAELAPEDDRDRSNVGAGLVLLGRHDEARGHLRHALALDPYSTYALQNLAALETMQERYRQALSLYRRLAQVVPHSPDAHHGTGTALYYLGRFEESLAALEHALALDPARQDIRENRDQVRRLLEQGASSEP